MVATVTSQVRARPDCHGTGDAVRPFDTVAIDAGRILGNRNSRRSKGPGNDIIQRMMPLRPARGMLTNNGMLTPGIYYYFFVFF